MVTRASRGDAVTVEAVNVGGIDRTEVALPPGVTVLTGRNATNRSSFLQAIMAALGSDRASLKADADEGRVAFELGDEVYTRTLARKNGTVRFGGDPYLEEPELADLFAFLLENNEARRAVERGEDLRNVIMRPIDTDEIEREVREAEARKRDLDEEIERVRRLEGELPDLKAERTELEDELESVGEDLATVEADLEGVDADPTEREGRREELEDVFAELRETRSALEDVEFELETERSTVEELEAERVELEDDLDAELEGAPGEEDDTDRLEGRIDDLRARKRSLDETINELQSVIGFNEEMLDGDGFAADHVLDGAPASVGDGGSNTDSEGGGGAGSGGAVTAQLVDGETTTCWTCGSAVDRDRIEDTLERLRSLRSEKLSERNEITDEIERLKEKRKQRRQVRKRRQRAERRLEQVETELEGARDRIAELEARREDIEQEIASLESRTEEFEETDYSEALELHREANRLELEIDRLESERADLTERIEEYEAEVEGLADLERRREEVRDELTDLRTRVDRIEAEAVERFNDHIESILAILAYDNIDRIWIERREDGDREGRRNRSRTTFDLHVVRSADGSAYRDSVDHLSESEREVTGLVFALAGYLVHDVHEELPVMLLDSLEAIDADRIAALVEYFEDHVEYLVVALLPEDARALDDEYTYVEEI